MFPNNRIQKHCRQKNILTLSLIFSSTSSSSSLSPSSSLSSLSSSSFCENLASPKKSFPSAIVAPRPRLLATRHAHFMKCDPTVIPVAWKTLSHAHTHSLSLSLSPSHAHTLHTVHFWSHALSFWWVLKHCTHCLFRWLHTHTHARTTTHSPTFLNPSSTNVGSFLAEIFRTVSFFSYIFSTKTLKHENMAPNF